MKRLNTINSNIPKLSEDIFRDRWNEEFHYIDFPRFRELVKHYRGGAYLDIGCFNSPMPFEIKKKFPKDEVVGLDHAKYVLDVLKKKAPEVDYVVGDCYSLPFEDEHFDYVVAGELVEHLEEPKKFVAEAMRVTKSEGYFALSTPFEETISRPPVSFEHLWAYTEQDVYNLLKPYGKVEITLNKDNVWVIMGFCKKK